MKKNQVLLIGNGLLFTLALVIYSGCSGGGSSTSSPPPTSTSRIKGVTSGLLGTGLVLQNNQTDDLEITTNEAFRFPTRVVDGDTCNVTIMSQPTSPAQTCEVINGDRMVTGSDITDVQVKCLTNISETFDNDEINSGYWHTSGMYDRKLVNKKLQFSLASSSELAYDYLPFLAPGCGMVSADVTITETTDLAGTGDKAFRTWLGSCGYHTVTDGEAPGTRTGDVNASIIWNDTEASYQVFRCLNDDCNNSDSVEYLTAGGSGGVPLGTALAGSTATLMIDWNSPLFTFQLNNDPSQSFNPVTAAPISVATPTPNKPEKFLGVQIALSDQGDQAEMVATVDNVIDGVLNDDFNSGTYLDSSFWKKTDGRRDTETGKLVLETGKEFGSDPGANNRFHNTTLISNYDMIFNGDEFVEAEITLDPETFVTDDGDNPAEVYALLEMEYRPPGLSKNDYTNYFLISAALKEGPSGVTAEILAEGCADYSCTSNLKHPIADANQTFNAAVVEGQAYLMRIEHLGNGAINITLDNSETLELDLSSIPEFASTEFSAVRLSTAAKGTDRAGEEAFIRAFFDNVQAGTP